MRRIALFIALLFSALIVAENVPHAFHRLFVIFSSPAPGAAFIVGAFILLPLAALWASWALLRKTAHAPGSFSVAAVVIFLAMDYFLPYPGPVKKLFFMIDEGRRIYGASLESFDDAPLLSKQGSPIGVALTYTVSFPTAGKYLIATHLSPVSRPLRPEDAGIDPSGSALEVLWGPGSMGGPDEWVTVNQRTSVQRTKRVTPVFIMYGALSREPCLFSLAADPSKFMEPLKDDPGPTRYRVELQVSGEHTMMDQAALLHFETRKAYNVRQFYQSAIEDQMPVCPALGVR